MSDITSWIPDSIKQDIAGKLVEFLADQAKKMAGEELAGRIRKYSSQATYQESVNKAIQTGLDRFIREYPVIDEDLAQAIVADRGFWETKSVQQELIAYISRPGAWMPEEKERLQQHFEDVLPKRISRERVDKAVVYLLRCITEELFTLPGAKEVREIYALQFQKMSLEKAQELVEINRKQLEATLQFNTELREAFLQLAGAMEKKLLAAPAANVPARVKPYHNLPRPDYTRFVGREEDLQWLRERLSPDDRIGQFAITGIGGVGKTSLALAIAYEYLEKYEELPTEERFDAIIWISAKEEVLTAQGIEIANLPEKVLRTLEDVYAAIAHTLDREDITRALPEDQSAVVDRALREQRTLLIMDNLESVKDERIKPFLRTLKIPTKAIITTREWLDVADVRELKGLKEDEADRMIKEESLRRKVRLNETQRKRIYDLTSGLPLPIKLAVARIAGKESFPSVERWLGDAVGELPEYCIEGQAELARHRDPNSWNLLLACSLFDRGAGASREALGFVTNLSLVDRDRGLMQLQRLFLINRTNDDRFWILPIVQRYANSMLSTMDNHQSMVNRWLDWIIGFVSGKGNEVEWKIELIREYGIEYQNILSAFRWCHQTRNWENLKTIAVETWPYAYVIGAFNEFQEIINGALAAAEITGDQRLLGRLILQEARLAEIQVQPDKIVLTLLSDAETYARRFKNYSDLGEALATRSSIFRQQGRDAYKNNDVEKAEKFLTRAEKSAHVIFNLWEKTKDPHLKYLACIRYAETEDARQNYLESFKWVDLAEECCAELGASRLMVTGVMVRRGGNLQRLGKYEESEKILIEAREFCIQWGLQRHIGWCDRRLAILYSVMGNYALACQYGEEASDIFKRIGLVHYQTQMDEMLGQWKSR